jgi:hypothetical protein
MWKRALVDVAAYSIIVSLAAFALVVGAFTQTRRPKNAPVRPGRG